MFVRREQGRRKLGNRSKPGVLLSHKDGIYCVQVMKTRTVIESKHDVFCEKIFPMKKDHLEQFTNGEFF